MKTQLIYPVIIPLAHAATTLIPSSAFDSQSSLESYFNYNYPWGNTHNGAAIMNKNNVAASAGELTLTSDYTGDESYAWTSGTVYAKQQFTVESGGSLTFSAQFQASTATGCWPAFWLNAASGWPPEIDIAEWKGSGDISFNTFNTSSQVASKNVPYPDDTEWHTVEAHLSDNGNNNVATTFYLDGKAQTTQVADGYVGKALNLIIDYQMEGSSGSPGPHSTTYFSIRDISVTSG